MLNSEQFYEFFRYVEVSTFDIASDAFATFKVLQYSVGLSKNYYSFTLYRSLLQDLVTKHKALCSEFLEHNYDRFFTAYQQLLLSENYVVCC